MTVSGTGTNPYQFTGRENDGTGLYFYRARYYSPTLQRFVAEDPISLGEGHTNLYGYVGENPVGKNDPTGQQAAAVGGGAAAVGIGGTGAAIIGGAAVAAGALACYLNNTCSCYAKYFAEYSSCYFHDACMNQQAAEACRQWATDNLNECLGNEWPDLPPPPSSAPTPSGDEGYDKAA